MSLARAALQAGAYLREQHNRRVYEVTSYQPDRGMVDLEDPLSPLTTDRVCDGRSLLLEPRTRSVGVGYVETHFELVHAAPTLGEMVHEEDIASVEHWGGVG
jgi:hypothetical protein